MNDVILLYEFKVNKCMIFDLSLFILLRKLHENINLIQIAATIAGIVLHKIKRPQTVARFQISVADKMAISRH